MVIYVGIAKAARRTRFCSVMLCPDCMREKQPRTLIWQIQIYRSLSRGSSKTNGRRFVGIFMAWADFGFEQGENFDIERSLVPNPLAAGEEGRRFDVALVGQLNLFDGYDRDMGLGMKVVAHDKCWRFRLRLVLFPDKECPGRSPQETNRPLQASRRLTSLKRATVVLISRVFKTVRFGSKLPP